MLTWLDDGRFQFRGSTFQTPQGDLLREAEPRDGDLRLFKSPPLIERYTALLDELGPRNVFELGVMGGGSALFIAQYARPARLVGVDRRPLGQQAQQIEARAAADGLAGVIRLHGEVDQADRVALAGIVEADLADADLDLVVDDCSHLYGPSRASFNELFPRLRPGGVYVIEDWRWAHSQLGQEPLEGWHPHQVPLTRLLFEIVLAIPSIPGLIEDFTIELDSVFVTRGEAAADPGDFDISACSNPRGQALLAADPNMLRLEQGDAFT